MLNMLDLPRDLRGAMAPADAGPAAMAAARERERRYGGPERRRAPAQSQRRLAQVIDEVDYGLLLLTPEGRVCHANRAARREFERGHPLMLMGDDTVFIPGHGPESSFGRERRSNPHVRGS